MPKPERAGNRVRLTASEAFCLTRRMGDMDQPGEAEPEAAAASVGQTLLFALLWTLPLGALIALAGMDALRQGAANAFRYAGF